MWLGRTRGASRGCAREASRHWSQDCRRVGGCWTSDVAPAHSCGRARRRHRGDRGRARPRHGRARRVAARARTSRSAGLPDLPFADDGFESVVASFVLNHVEDPRAGARELARVAAPGGSVRATIWTSAADRARCALPAGLRDERCRRPVFPRLPEDLDFERQPRRARSAPRGAGLAVLEARHRSLDLAGEPRRLWAGVTGGREQRSHVGGADPRRAGAHADGARPAGRAVAAGRRRWSSFGVEWRTSRRACPGPRTS